MAYITRDQLNLYLQQVSSQSAAPGANGTVRSRSTLTGPRPPTFGNKLNSRKIFQDGPPSATLNSPRTPTTAQMDNAVKSLSLSPMPGTANNRSSSPILESMGESGPPAAAEPVMESMGSDGYSVEELLHQQRLAAYGTVHNQQGWPAPGYSMGHQHQQQYPGGYVNQPISPQFYQQQQPSVHMSQEQYLHLQQQQQQQQEYIRQQHAAHAAAHGYYPATSSSSSSSTQLPGPATPTKPQSSAQTSSTIMPRIVPIVDIPKYTIVNPPKAEVIEDQDDDLAPELPPRDAPKAKDANSGVKPPSPRTPIESATPLRPPSPRIDVSQKSMTKLTESPRSKPTTPVTTENSMPAEEERVPLPPPREFRRKSDSPTTSTFTSSILSVRPSPDGIFRPTPPSKSPSGSAPSSSSKKSGIPTQGTVRANSAKFNAMAAESGNDNSVATSPKAISPKVASSIVSPTSATSSATASPWTIRKAVDQPQINSPSKLSSSAASTSSSLSDTSAEPSRRNSAPVSLPLPETYADKELPPIKPNLDPSRPITPPKTQEDVHQFNGTNGQYDVDYDSKCIVTEEDTAGVIPLADDASKEIVVEQETPATAITSTATSSSKSAPPKKPARSNSSGSANGNQGIFVCSSCDEPISGMMITAMGKRWHSDHFVCCVCDTNLEHVQFFQKDGQPYCHLDYHEKFSPKCGHCDTAIENECLTALGKSWHPGHFFCRECGDPFDEDGYMVHDDFPYCEKDYLRLFAPKCAACQDPIQGDFISALKGKWHRDCFGCTVCHIGFDASSYFVENGKPYCQAHYKTGAAQSVAA